MKAQINPTVYLLLRKQGNREKVREAISTAISGGKSEPIVVTDDKGKDVTVRFVREAVAIPS